MANRYTLGCDDMHRISLYLGRPQRDTLLKLSVRTGLPVSELIRRAVDAFVEHQTLKQGDATQRLQIKE